MKNPQQIADDCLKDGTISPHNITGTVVRAHTISPYATYCHFNVNAEEKDPKTRFGELLRQWGLDLEVEYVNRIDPRVRDQRYGYDRPGFEAFIRAAQRGERYIYNPPLFFLGENLAGRPDLLERNDSLPSVFGDHHYTITEIKFSKDFEDPDKRHYLLQAVLYNFLLGRIQGHTPERFRMVDRQFQGAEIAYSRYEIELKTALSEIEDIRVGRARPEPVFGTCDAAYWSHYCNREAEAARDVSLVPFLKDRRIRSQMIAAGIRILDQVAAASPDEISKFKWVGARGKLISEYAKCLVSGRPSVLSKVDLPKAEIAEVYFDVEDTGSVHPRIPKFVFLIGAAIRKTGCQPECFSFVIKSENDVRGKTLEFLECLESLGEYSAYFWSPKELVEFRRIFELHHLKGSAVDKFLASSLDLKATFVEKVCFPVHGNSVKEIAKLLGFKWREEGVDAMEGMVLTYEYLEKGDEGALRKVQTYNFDDCLAMITIKDWLTANAV